MTTMDNAERAERRARQRELVDRLKASGALDGIFAQIDAGQVNRTGFSEVRFMWLRRGPAAGDLDGMRFRTRLDSDRPTRCGGDGGSTSPPIPGWRVQPARRCARAHAV